MRVAVITFQAGPVVEAYARETKLPWPILADKSLRLYSAFGMERGRWRDLLGPAAFGVYFKLMARGRRPRTAAGADVKQLGGDVLVSPDGIVQFHHVASGPADRPVVDDLLAVVRAD